MQKVTCTNCSHTFTLDPKAIWSSPDSPDISRDEEQLSAVIPCPRCEHSLLVEVKPAREPSRAGR